MQILLGECLANEAEFVPKSQEAFTWILDNFDNEDMRSGRDGWTARMTWTVHGCVICVLPLKL